MNQIIIIGEVVKLEELNTGLEVTIKTKDFEKNNKQLAFIVEPGYQKEMVRVLETKPLIAIKAGLKITKGKIGFVAEKMSVLKLTEDEESNKIVEKIEKDYKDDKKKTVDKK